MGELVKMPTIYVLTSLTCKETWPENRYGWCVQCYYGKKACTRQVVRMTTDPKCPVAASYLFSKKTLGRTAYFRFGGWYKSCLTPARLFGDNLELDLGNEAAAVRWLLGEDL
jgi:hypothetical protein